MSNYIVEPENIARVANFIAAVNFNMWTIERPEELEKALHYCKDKYGYIQPEKVCKALSILNYLAVDGRYKKDTSPEEIETYYNTCIEKLESNIVPAPSWKDGRRILSGEHYQLYRNIQCLVYQCDSDTTYKNELFKALKELQTVYAKWIVENLEDMQHTIWK